MNRNYFDKYSLSDDSLNKLKSYHVKLVSKSAKFNSTWHNLFKKEIETTDNNNGAAASEIEENEITIVANNDTVNENCSFMPSSQFFFSQVEKKKLIAKTEKTDRSSIEHIVNCIYETLESNKTLDTDCLKNLDNEKIIEIFEILSQRLDFKETFYLCNYLCEMELDAGIQYVKIICSKLLFPKVINLKESSREILAIIPKMQKKFPDDIEKLIFIPLINADLQEISTITAIIKSYLGEQKPKLISEFLTNVNELQLWHTTILPVLIDIKIDSLMKDRLINLLAEKSTTFSKDKNYSKFLLFFIKCNSPFTDEQKYNLHEIAGVNDTIFKKAINNILDNMYLHRDLWHIN